MAQTQGVIKLELSGSKLTIDYGVMVHRMIKYENSSVPVKEIDFGIKVQILINQLKYGCENVLSANGIKVVTDHIYNELVFCRRKFVVVITM